MLGGLKFLFQEFCTAFLGFLGGSELGVQFGTAGLLFFQEIVEGLEFLLELLVGKDFAGVGVHYDFALAHGAFDSKGSYRHKAS
ncbi:MAG: hypothetical protein IJ909_03040 [Fibrobacter sp.]|nr:hypothetical protein [Fibrobacter sp.]